MDQDTGSTIDADTLIWIKVGINLPTAMSSLRCVHIQGIDSSETEIQVIHLRLLTRHSKVLQEMFGIPQGPGHDGSSRGNPLTIHIPWKELANTIAWMFQ